MIDKKMPPAKTKMDNAKRNWIFPWGSFKKSAKVNRADRKQVSPVVMAKMTAEAMVIIPPIGPNNPLAISDTTPPASADWMAANRADVDG